MVSSAALSLLLLPACTLAAFNLLEIADDSVQGPFTGDNEACLAAYNATIDCDQALLQLERGADSLPTEQELDSLCTTTCLNSLRRWVRGGPGCEGEEYLGFFGLANGTSELFGDRPASIADLQQYWITTTYHQSCLVNLNPKPEDPKYCILINSTTPGTSNIPYLDVSNPDQLCKENTCAAQASYLWYPMNLTYIYDSTGKEQFTEENGVTGYDEACPEGNTNGFPKREKDITPEELTSAGDEPIVVGGTRDGESGAQGSNEPNSAAGKVVELSVIVSAALGAVVYMLL